MNGQKWRLDIAMARKGARGLGKWWKRERAPTQTHQTNYIIGHKGDTI
jgi:hypothetical protein